MWMQLFPQPLMSSAAPPSSFQEIKREELGNLSVGSVADIAIFTLKKGNFGFIDSHNYLLKGTQKLETELTIRSGKIVYDLNGLGGRTDKESTILTIK